MRIHFDDVLGSSSRRSGSPASLKIYRLFSILGEAMHSEKIFDDDQKQHIHYFPFFIEKRRKTFSVRKYFIENISFYFHSFFLSFSYPFPRFFQLRIFLSFPIMFVLLPFFIAALKKGDPENSRKTGCLKRLNPAH